MPSLALQGILLVYDITNRWSFDGIDRWIKEIDEVVYSPRPPSKATPIPGMWADIPHLQREPLWPPLAAPPMPRFCASPAAGRWLQWHHGLRFWAPRGPSARNRWRAALRAGGWGWVQRGILPLHLC